MTRSTATPSVANQAKARLRKPTALSFRSSADLGVGEARGVVDADMQMSKPTPRARLARFR